MIRIPGKAIILKERLGKKNTSLSIKSSIRPIDFSEYSSVNKSSSTIRINVNTTLRISGVRLNKLEGSLRYIPSSCRLTELGQSIIGSVVCRSSPASTISEHFNK